MELKKDLVKFYDLVYLMNENCTTRDISETENKIREIIGNTQIKKFEHIGLKKLAYTIKGNTSGYYIFIRFKQTENTMKLLEKELRASKNIIKFISIIIDEETWNED